MNLAIIGCSYSNYYDGDCFGNTYPKLIADNYSNINVYDASLGGASNDSCYLRLQNIEKNFGSIDKIIVQLTLPYRTSIALTKKAIKGYMPWHHQKNYYYGTDKIKGLMFLTQGRFKDSRFLFKWKKNFKYHPYFASHYFQAWQTTYDPYWQTQKEIDLINCKYGKENVLFFSWLAEDKKMINLPENYIGSVQEYFGTDMEKYKIDKQYHFNKDGHKAVHEWLKPNIKELFK